jgi:hypothetical protein
VAANQSFRSSTLAYATPLGSKKLDRPLPNFDRCRHSRAFFRQFLLDTKRVSFCCLQVFGTNLRTT